MLSHCRDVELFKVDYGHLPGPNNNVVPCSEVLVLCNLLGDTCKRVISSQVQNAAAARLKSDITTY